MKLVEKSIDKRSCWNRVSVQGLEIGFNAGMRRSSSGTKMIGARLDCSDDAGGKAEFVHISSMLASYSRDVKRSSVVL